MKRTGLQARIEVQRAAFALQVDLTVGPGEVVALVGPNGAGKSTLLRALAGLLPVAAGAVDLDGERLVDTAAGLARPPYERAVGVVFQDYLLFPHLSVLDNVAFGPRARGASRADARTQARGWLERLDLAGLADVAPRQVSGGQAQRVALARALATEPGLLLLDEPLAALDARTRLLVRGELRRHLADFDGATVVVTHDPVDAAVLGDRLVVLEAGRVVQTGTPLEVAARPRTDYVARLVGLNLLAGTASDYELRLPGGGVLQLPTTATGPAYAAFRPAAVSLYPSRPAGSPRNVWVGTVAGLEPHGEGVRVQVDTGATDAAGERRPGTSVLAEVTAAAVAELDLRPGAEVWVSVKASDIAVYPD